MSSLLPMLQFPLSQIVEYFRKETYQRKLFRNWRLLTFCSISFFDGMFLVELFILGKNCYLVRIVYLLWRSVDSWMMGCSVGSAQQNGEAHWKLSFLIDEDEMIFWLMKSNYIWNWSCQENVKDVKIDFMYIHACIHSDVFQLQP